MSDYKFQYEVKDVSEDGKSIVITYTYDGKDPVDVGARAPYQNESLELIVDMFAPTMYYCEQEAKHLPVSIGDSGSRTHTVDDLGKDEFSGLSDEEKLSKIKSNKLDELNLNVIQKEESGTVDVDGVLISTSLASQSRLSAIITLIQCGYTGDIKIKSSSNDVISVNEVFIKSALSSIAEYSMDLLSWQEYIIAKIKSSSTIEDVYAIQIV